MPNASRFFIGSSCALLLGACSSDGTVPQLGFQLPPSSAVSGSGALATSGRSGGVTAGASGRTGVTGAAGSAGSSVAAAGSGGAAGWTEEDSDAGVIEVTAGSGGASGGGSNASGSGGTDVPASGPKPRCKTKPSQVAIIGDSYINYTAHTFPQDLEREVGETWRMYAVPGTAMATGGIAGLIPPQLDQALAADDDIVAVIMDGGGNDILIPAITWPNGGQCKESEISATLNVCQNIVATAFEAAEKLLQKAADAGIRDTVYFFYPHIPGGGLGGAHPNVILDYSLPKAKDFCDSAVTKTQGKLRCHFIDLVPVFDGHPEWFADDGIHENSQGSAVLAKEITKKLKEDCVAQPVESGCCEP